MYVCIHVGSRTGMPVLASYNIPSGAVSETVKNDIITTCTQLVASQSC